MSFAKAQEPHVDAVTATLPDPDHVDVVLKKVEFSAVAKIGRGYSIRIISGYQLVKALRLSGFLDIL